MVTQSYRDRIGCQNPLRCPPILAKSANLWGRAEKNIWGKVLEHFPYICFIRAIQAR